MGDRHTGERAGMARGARGIGGFGGRARLLFVDRDKGVDRRVVLRDATQEKIGQFQTGNLFGFERAGELFEAGFKHYSITFGTR